MLNHVAETAVVRAADGSWTWKVDVLCEDRPPPPPPQLPLHRLVREVPRDVA